MSEYQYYEFQAIDRPLTEKEMGELRSYSTRARITPTSLVNDYSWDNFKGEEDAWMERYFDAFLYLANWGTHVLKLRLPTRLLDAKIASSYCAGERASVREKSGKVILTFASEDEEGGDWVDGDGLKGAQTRVHAAAWWYSCSRPPRRSRRHTFACTAEAIGSRSPSGGDNLSPRCGRSAL
jgi:hypothetical protein